MKSRSYEIELSRSAYAAGLSPLASGLARLDKARPRMLFARLAVLVLILAAVMHAFPGATLALFSAIFLFGLADFLVQSAFTPQSIGVSFEPAVHGRSRVEFSDEGIVEHSASRVRRWSWDAVRRIHFPAGQVVIELAGWDMLILPDRLWPGAEEREAFLAELGARHESSGAPSLSLPAHEATALVQSIEPILLARIALAVATFQLLFEAGLAFASSSGVGHVLLALALAAFGGAIAWVASGRAFRWLAARSPSRAIALAWTIFGLLAALFALWILGRI